MFVCAQLDTNGVCFCISRLNESTDALNIIPVKNYDEQLLGKKYANGRFYGLVAEAKGNIVYVSWRDLDGNLVNETEEVKALYNNIEIIVQMDNGQGSFVVDAPLGNYQIEIVSASGCRTSAEVTISA